MPVCFVIQPFDNGVFDQRFEDVFEPALNQAGLEAYRVDQDPSVEIAIHAIEDGIRRATICLADITTDNPNVWYELGFAFAADRPVIIVCADDRSGSFPFDIQHRMIIKYASNSLSDFEKLRDEICKRATAMLTKSATMRNVAETEPLALRDGLTQHELLILAILAGDTAVPTSRASLFSLKTDAERAGLTPVGFGIAFRRLARKNLVETVDNEHNDYLGAQITQKGWKWIDNNDSFFSLNKPPPEPKEFDDDIPF